MIVATKSDYEVERLRETLVEQCGVYSVRAGVIREKFDFGKKLKPKVRAKIFDKLQSNGLGVCYFDAEDRPHFDDFPGDQRTRVLIYIADQGFGRLVSRP